MPDRDFVQERQETFELLSNHSKLPVSDDTHIENYDTARKQLIIKSTSPEAFSSEKWFIETKQNLNVLADRRVGIISKYEVLEKTDKQEVHTYIRDARNQEKNRPTEIESAAFENWAIMGLSAFQSVYQMILNNDLEDPYFQVKVEIIKEKAKFFLETISHEPHPQAFVFFTIKNILAPLTKEYFSLKDNKEAEKIIYQLKDFGNLDEPPCALVTISKTTANGESKEFAQIDVPLYQLTQSQQIDYLKVLLHENKGDSIPSELESLKQMAEESLGKDGLPKWYLAVKNSHTKLMVLHHIPQILEGRQIPTQMLNILPGMRNAGEERIYELGEGIPKQKLQSFHAGSMGQDTSASFEENVRLTAENMKQFQALTGVKKIRVNSWISPWFSSFLSRFKMANESRLYYVQQAAAEKINASDKAGFNVTYANTPLEYTRAFLSSDRTIENEIWNDGIEQLRQYIGRVNAADIEALIQETMLKYPDGIESKEAYKKVNSNSTGDTDLAQTIANELNHNSTIEEFHAVLAKYKNVNLATKKIVPIYINGNSTLASEIPNIVASDTATRLFQHMVELQRLKSSGLFSASSYIFGLQKNAQRAAKYKQMQSLVNELEGKPTSALITGCKSGKDREGLLAILIMIDVVASAFRNMSTQLAKIGSKNGIVESNVAKSIVEAEHITTRAGGQGGTEGAKGIKNEGRVLPTWLKSLFNLIAKKEANSNKKIKKEKLSEKETAIVKGRTSTSDVLVVEALTSRDGMMFSDEDRRDLVDAHLIGPLKGEDEKNLPQAHPVAHGEDQNDALNAQGVFGHEQEGTKKYIENSTIWKIFPENGDEGMNGKRPSQ